MCSAASSPEVGRWWALEEVSDAVLPRQGVSYCGWPQEQLKLADQMSLQEFEGRRKKAWPAHCSVMEGG